MCSQANDQVERLQASCKETALSVSVLQKELKAANHSRDVQKKTIDSLDKLLRQYKADLAVVDSDALSASVNISMSADGAHAAVPSSAETRLRIKCKMLEDALRVYRSALFALSAEGAALWHPREYR